MRIQDLRRDRADAVLDHIEEGADIIVPLANGEPKTLIDALDENADSLSKVRVHQMHPLYDHPYLHGAYGDNLRHVSYFLSHIARSAFHEGGCDAVPANFSEVPLLLSRTTKCSIVLASAAPPDDLGFFSLGTNADYTARFIGKVPFFLEVNPNMPRSFGENNIHVSQVAGWTEADYPLVEVEAPEPSEEDRKIAAMIADRIPDGATVQAGIGAIPNTVVSMLTDRRNLGVHTELFSDGMMALFEHGAINGTKKRRRPGKSVTTFAIGTRKLYDFLHENAAIEFIPVDWVNDPRVIGSEDAFVSINATTEVDFLGQVASETIGGRQYSGSGGQSDFALGAMFSPQGQGFLAMHATAKHGEVSRVVPRLTAGSAVTTSKNTVDKVVTEYGVAELRGKSIRQRTEALIQIAAPQFREDLETEAKSMGFLS